MILSPCRFCPKRHQDKNLCLATCDLINRLQALDTQRREYACFSGVDMADEGRYRITTAFDVHRSGATSLPY